MRSNLNLITTIPDQRALFERERFNEMYSSTSFLTALSFINCFDTIWTNLIATALILWMTNLDIGYVDLNIALFLALQVTASIGLLISIMAETPEDAINWLSPIMLVPTLFAGFAVPVDSIWDGVSWIHWISHFYYCYQ